MLLNVRLGLAAAAVTFGAVILGGCSKSDIELLGVKPGMTLDDAKAAAPSGSRLYCHGDGDTAFDSHFPKSSPDKWCAWVQVDSEGKTAFSKADFGDGAKSTEALLIFGNQSGQYTLKSLSASFPENEYSDVVAAVKGKLGSPDSSLIGEAKWIGKDGTVKVDDSTVSAAPDTRLELRADVSNN
jgi:hypothetical protein